MTRRPEVLDDFIRNVLLKMGMTETLDMFQREWHRMQAEGKLSSGDMGTVPDIYLRNQELDEQVLGLRREPARLAPLLGGGGLRLGGRCRTGYARRRRSSGAARPSSR